MDALRSSDRLSRRDRRMVRDLTAPPAVVGAGAVPVPMDELVDMIDPGHDTPRVVIDREVARAVGDWIRDDLPPEVAARLQTWMASTGATTLLPAGLAAAIEPYVFRLAPALELVD